MIQIEQDIYIEDTFKGVTVGGLIFPHGTIMIDAPLRVEEGRAWQSMLLNQRRGSNRLLVLLDAHPDRTLGSRGMDCTILAHKNTSEVFRQRPMIFKGFNQESGAVWETYTEAIGMRWAIPDITFSDQMCMHWGGAELILEYHPGPSSGSIWAIIPDLQIIFVGDAVVINQPVFLEDADLDQWLASLELLKSDYKSYRIISSRGGITDITGVRAQIRYINRIKKGLDKLADQGAQPESTGKLVNQLLRGLSFPDEWRDVYAQRLKHGLMYYYMTHYDVANVELDEQEEDAE